MSSSSGKVINPFPEPHRNEEQLIWLDLRELVGVAGYDSSNPGVATNGVAQGVTARVLLSVSRCTRPAETTTWSPCHEELYQDLGTLYGDSFPCLGGAGSHVAFLKV